MKRCLAALVVCAVSLACTAAEASRSGRDRLVERLMVKSGIHEQVAQFPALLMAGLEKGEAYPHMSGDEVDQLRHAVETAFAADILRGKLREHFTEKMGSIDTRKVLKWLDSPLGKRITRLEVSSSTPEAAADRESMSGELLRDEERVGKMRRLDTATGATEMSYNMVVNMQLAVAVGIASMMPPSRRPTYDEIRRRIEEHTAQTKPDIERETLADFLYTYRALSLGEVERYIRFAESRAGAKYHAVASDGLNSAVADATRHLVDIMLREFREPQ